MRTRLKVPKSLQNSNLRLCGRTCPRFDFVPGTRTRPEGPA